MTSEISPVTDQQTITIFVNGNAVQTVADVLTALLANYQIYPSTKGVAVAVNSQVIRKENWYSYHLHDQDKIEIVYAQQGG
jgi:sulfur carrier protein